jgi:simple sugar transport system ATP-binding protein
VDDYSRAHRALTSGSATDNALELHDITKRFGSVVALDNVSLSVRRGRITALLGENGAGKTTLMRIAFGMIQPDAGSITISGVRTKLASPSDAIAAGIGMVHQQFSLIPAMTVAENVALGGHGKYSAAQIGSILSDIAGRTGLKLDPRLLVRDLGSADRQKLEIIRTLAHNAKLMILDEPTAVLTSKDVDELFKQLKTFASEGGAVVLITHKLTDAHEHADDVTVLRRGQVVLNARMTETTTDSLAEAMLGESLSAESMKTRQASASSSVVASMKAAVLRDNPRRSPIDLEVKTSEILGVAALDGTARSLLRTLANRESLLSGSVQLPLRIGFVPENRKDEALITDFSLSENLALANAGSRQGVMDWKAIRENADRIISEFDVRTTGAEVSASQLSGGNQQRFVLGRELRDNPPLLVMENPTQGLDVNAAGFVHQRLRQARDDGSAVVFYSSDLEELADLADRVLVVTQSGVATVPPDRDTIGNALLGTDGS